MGLVQLSGFFQCQVVFTPVFKVEFQNDQLWIWNYLMQTVLSKGCGREEDLFFFVCFINNGLGILYIQYAYSYQAMLIISRYWKYELFAKSNIAYIYHLLMK